jgi:hypothetical protein
VRTLDDVLSEIENLRLVNNNKSMDLWENYEKLTMAVRRVRRGVEHLEKKGFASSAMLEAVDAIAAEVKQYKDAC